MRVKARRCAELCVAERLNERTQPASRDLSVRIREHEDLALRVGGCGGPEQVVDLLARVLGGTTGNDEAECIKCHSLFDGWMGLTNV